MKIYKFLRILGQTGVLTSMLFLASCGCDHVNKELQNYQEATCIEEGFTGEVYCFDCEKVIQSGTIAEKLPHEPDDRLLSEEIPTCLEEGYTGDVYCSFCREILTSGMVIPAKGHTPSDPEGVAEVTCISDGYTGDIYCIECNEMLSPGESVVALGHDYTVTDCELENTCQRCTTIIPAKGHTWTAPTISVPKKCSICAKTSGNPLTLPFYGVESDILMAETLSGDKFFEMFTSGEINVRTEREAIDYYTSTEGLDAVYDDGETVLLVSASGWYLGEVSNSTTVKITSMLQVPYAKENDRYTSASCSVYKNENGFRILGQVTNYNREILYLDLTNGTYHYIKINNNGVRSSFDDRYTCFYNNKSFTIIDKQNCEAQVFYTPENDLDYIPYFNGNGEAILLFNTKYDYDDITDVLAFHDYSSLYYYSWVNGAANRVAYEDYSVIHYADPSKILVENEFTYDMISADGMLYQINKKNIVDNNTAMYSFQQGLLWQYGNDAYYYHTFYTETGITLLTSAFGAPSSERVDFSYVVGWSGRYSDCHNYEYTDHSIDHESVFDHYNGEIHVLSKYHRSDRIYNQNHVIWNTNLDRNLGGLYGVYNLITDTYTQRYYTY